MPPLNFEDAMDSYEKVLEIAGEIAGEIVAPNAESVDHEGPHLIDGHVEYAEGTKQNLDALVKAGLMGISLPRRYNGLNFSLVPYIMAADMVSRADASFVNIWGLQDCAETIYEFADEDQRQRFLPRVCAGETMAMDLTEPDAGSDLQAVMLKATEAEDGTWRLNGVKRFHHQRRRTNRACIGSFRSRIPRRTRPLNVHFRPQERTGSYSTPHRK